MTEEAQGAAEAVTDTVATPATQNEGVKDSTQSEESTPELSPEDRAKRAEEAAEARQKRIARQTAAYRDLQRKYQETTRELEQYKPKQPRGEPEPKQDDFENVEDYYLAKGKWDARQEFLKEQEYTLRAQQQQRIEAENAVIRERMDKHEAEIRATHADYDEKTAIVNESLQAAPDGMGKQAFAQFMMEADNAPALFYEIGSNPDIIDKMQGMSPVQIVKELTRLEIALGDKPKTRAETKPKPPSSTKPGASSGRDESAMSGRELLRRHGLN